jgi:hypothetical protein
MPELNMSRFTRPRALAVTLAVLAASPLVGCKSRDPEAASDVKVAGGVAWNAYKSNVDAVNIALLDRHLMVYSATRASSRLAVLLTAATQPVDRLGQLFATGTDNLKELRQPLESYDLVRASQPALLASDPDFPHRDLSVVLLEKPLPGTSRLLPIATLEQVERATELEVGGYGCHGRREDQSLDCPKAYRKARATSVALFETAPGKPHYFVLTFEDGVGMCYGDGGAAAVGVVDGKPMLLGAFVGWDETLTPSSAGSPESKPSFCGRKTALFRALADVSQALDSLERSGKLPDAAP